MIENKLYREAVELLGVGAPSVASDTEYHELIAHAYLYGNQYLDAISTYTKLIHQDNEQAKWWFSLAISYDAAAEFPSALQAYSQALQLSNLSPSLLRRSQQRVVALQ